LKVSISEERVWVEMSLDKEMVIAVLMGGPGAEREVSLASGKAVLKALLEKGYKAVGVEVSDDSPELPDEVDLVFNAIHGTYGEDGGLQKYLGDKGIAYTGAGEETSRVAFDKVLSKEIFLQHEVPTPLSETIDCSNGARLPKMVAPFVVKPPREGSSVGIKVVKEQSEALSAMEHGAKFSPDILVEQFIEGRELTVGIMGGELLPVVEIIPPDGEWYDMATKYPWLSGKCGGSQYVCPANLTPEELVAVNEAAKKAYDALGIEVYSRVDVLLNSSGIPYVLEANTIPGMTETSLLPMAGAEAGYSFGDLCVRIAELSLEERG
jgi:D-alanine-D-alanine ligase